MWMGDAIPAAGLGLEDLTNLAATTTGADPATVRSRGTWGGGPRQGAMNEDDGAVVIARAPADTERDGRVSESRREVFARGYAAHHRDFARLAMLLCGDVHLAEDAVAEACARVWPKFRRGSVDDLVPYLRVAVVNEVRRRLRRGMLERRDAERQVIDLREGTDDDHSVEDRNVLLPALAALPYEQRAVIVLRFYEDLTEEEIAEVLNVPTGTVKSRCARGLEQLRRLMGGRSDA
jgi:RNA polymerase sigma-70 factor (sigma-E family)